MAQFEALEAAEESQFLPGTSGYAGYDLGQLACLSHVVDPLHASGCPTLAKSRLVHRGPPCEYPASWERPLAALRDSETDCKLASEGVRARRQL